MILLVAALLLAGEAAGAELASPAEIAARLGLDQAAIEKVKSGEVVVQELEASSDKDLSLAIIAAIDAPLERAKEFVNADKMVELSTVTLSHGDIDTSTFSLADMKLPDDALARLVDDPSGTFFMSRKEAESVEQAAKQGKAQALAAYQAVLSARAKAYWEGGADAITPYEGDGRSPKVDLGHANEAARKLVQAPPFVAALDAVPSKGGGPAVHRLRWAVQKGRDQAAPVLIHRIMFERDDGQLFAQRRFYSGYDYDALQIVTGVLPASENRCAVFYTNHTYTAQVAGFGGSAKRSIGRKLMSKEIVAEIQRAQKAVSGGL
jgi:hypothetical protein